MISRETRETHEKRGLVMAARGFAAFTTDDMDNDVG